MNKTNGFTNEEKEAMRTRSEELRAEPTKRSRGKSVDKEAEVLAKLSQMPQPDRAIGEQLHAIIKETAPELTSKLWYGMPAYCKDEKIICFFQNAQKFKTRYSTLGFQQDAKLDDGDMWPVAYALVKITETEKKKIISLVQKAVK